MKVGAIRLVPSAIAHDQDRCMTSSCATRGNQLLRVGCLSFFILTRRRHQSLILINDPRESGTLRIGRRTPQGVEVARLARWMIRSILVHVSDANSTAIARSPDSKCAGTALGSELCSRTSFAVPQYNV
jgi:hypothetical protein